MHAWFRILALGLSLLLNCTGCATVDRGTLLPFSTVAQDEAQGGFVRRNDEQPEIYIFATTQDVEDFVPELINHLFLADQLRRLDYDEVFGVLVTQGLKLSGGHRATVKHIRRQGERVDIETEFIDPTQEDIVSFGTTAPLHLVAVRKEGMWDQPIQFRILVDDVVVAETTHAIP
jgi:hypothetical protein